MTLCDDNINNGRTLEHDCRAGGSSPVTEVAAGPGNAGAGYGGLKTHQK